MTQPNETPTAPRDDAALVPEATAPNDLVGQTLVMHGIGCNALRAAWDGPNTCSCGGRRVTILGRLDAPRDEFPEANTPPEWIKPSDAPVADAAGRA